MQASFPSLKEVGDFCNIYPNKDYFKGLERQVKLLKS